MKTTDLVDVGTTHGEVCSSMLLHVYHNSEPFGKFPFLRGEYKEMDMSDLNLEVTKEYALYIALRSSGQGKNKEVNTKYSIQNIAARFLSLRSIGYQKSRFAVS